MVSIKAVALVALSASAVTAFPQRHHARFHMPGTGTGMMPWPRPTDGGHHHHHHHHNETDAPDAGPSPTDGMSATLSYQPNDATPSADSVDASSQAESDVQPTAADAVVAQDQASTTCTSFSTFTQYVTSTDIATVTAGPARDAAAAAAPEANTYSMNDVGQWGGPGSHSWNWGSPSAAPTTFFTATSAPAAPSAPAASSAPAVSISVTMASSSAAPAPSASSGSTGSTSGSKKGLSYNSASLLDLFSDAVWAYNWADGAGGSMPSGVEYVPMLWGESDVGGWTAAADSAIASGSQHVLSFNEPDLGSQSNIDPSTAAKLHMKYITPLQGKVSTGSPAVTNSAQSGQGLDWMGSFLADCGMNNGCNIDFLALHWYNSPGTFSDFQNHIGQAVALGEKYGISKVWITEFAINGSDDDQTSFLEQAIPWLESQSSVERYAYFMVGNGQMLTNGAVNSVGKAYIA